jgi:hypothetical protein
MHTRRLPVAVIELTMERDKVWGQAWQRCPHIVEATGAVHVPKLAAVSLAAGPSRDGTLTLDKATRNGSAPSTPRAMTTTGRCGSQEKG